MQEINVQVPATTSNLGPGFDCLGIALRLSNLITVSRAESAGENPAHPMVQQAAKDFFARAERQAFGFRWRIAGETPVSRGLGSSVTLRLGILHGLNHLAGEPLRAEEVYEICTVLEGHPDNAAPAQFGGFTVVSGSEVLRFPVSPKLRFALLIPDFEIRTADARRLLPAEISRAEAVRSSGRACRITAAFAARQYERLGGEDAFADAAFHQSHRQSFIPFLPDVIAAGRAAGALGGFLSGSGSTIACLTLGDGQTAAAAMLAAAGAAAGPGARTVVTTADNRGVRIRASRG